MTTVELAALLVLALLAALTPAQATREVVTFDFGWRWRLGLHSIPKKDAPPEPPCGGPRYAGPPCGTGPGANPPEAEATYDDSAWAAVHLPHDGLIAQGASKIACPTGCSGQSFIPRHVMWYRKTFGLPASWSSEGEGLGDSSVWVEFDGVFHAAIVYLNGAVVARNAEGYLGFRVSLDNSTGLLRGSGEKNVLAVFVDPDGGAGFSQIMRSGWWYEGSGIYRHSRIVRSAAVQIAQDGLVARSEISPAHPSSGAESDSAALATQSATATLTTVATIENTGPAAVAAGGHIAVTLVEKVSGAVVGAATSAALGVIPAGGSVDASAVISVSNPKLWSSRRPELYVVMAKVVGAAGAADRGQQTLDSVNITHGFRTLVFNGGTPSCALNGDAFKWRGFCDHDNFAVVGAALPDRIKLFRAQMSRAVGGNSRRTSHNPPDPIMLDIYDALGMLVMDETRVHRNGPRTNAHNTSVDALASLVRRDRNHASVAMWSFCNEMACESAGVQLAAPLMNNAAKTFDGTRPTAANTPGWRGNFPPWVPKPDLLTESIDIQGFSHTSAGLNNAAIQFHKQNATKPTFGSECCSCNTMRDEDTGCKSSDGHSLCVQKSFAADCSEQQTAVYDNPEFVVGTMVWTLFDYLGEPSGGWPHVISSFGQFDVAGFPKAQAHWYRNQWLLRSNDSQASKPFSTANEHRVHLVESWESLQKKLLPNATSVAPCSAESAAQKFDFNATSGHITAPGNLCVDGTCADVSSGRCVPIKLAPCSSTVKGQRWAYTPASKTFVNQENKGCLDNWKSGASTDVGVWECSGASTDNGSQQWTRLGSGFKVGAENVSGAEPGPRCLSKGGLDVRTIHVYSSAASVELSINGKSLGEKTLATQEHKVGAVVVQSWAEWDGVAWHAGNATAVARNALGEIVAVDTRLTCGAAAKIALSLDAPSPLTGTGVALLANGADAALVRASVLDSAGNVVHNAANPISFAVKSGSGRLVGTHNGQVESHESSTQPTVAAYHGLARAVVMTTSVAALPAFERELLAAIDLDSMVTGLRSDEPGAVAGIVVQASSPGLGMVELTIPVSTDPIADSVLAVAATAAGQRVEF